MRRPTQPLGMKLLPLSLATYIESILPGQTHLRCCNAEQYTGASKNRPARCCYYCVLTTAQQPTELMDYYVASTMTCIVVMLSTLTCCLANPLGWFLRDAPISSSREVYWRLGVKRGPRLVWRGALAFAMSVQHCPWYGRFEYLVRSGIRRHALSLQNMFSRTLLPRNLTMVAHR